MENEKELIDEVCERMPMVLLSIVLGYAKGVYVGPGLYRPRPLTADGLTRLVSQISYETTIQEFQNLCKENGVSTKNFDEATQNGKSLIHMILDVVNV